GAEAAGHPLLRQALKATEAAGGEAIGVSGEILAKISRRENPQTVLAVFEQRFTPLAALQPGDARGWGAPEAGRGPGDPGAGVRAAAAAGCGGVILVGDCCAPYSVEAVRATMGSIFAVPIARASTAEFVAWRAAWSGSVVGTLLTATTEFRAAVYSPPSLI